MKLNFPRPFLPLFAAFCLPLGGLFSQTSVPTTMPDSTARTAAQATTTVVRDSAAGKPERSATELQTIHEKQADLARHVEETENSVQALTNSIRNEQAAKYDKRSARICAGPDFVKAANVSLSALTLSSVLTDYLNEVGQLNNPENEELGVSLTTSVNKIIDEKIFHGKPKVGGAKKSRFLSVVQTVVKSPFVSTLTGGIPVVSSLGSVTDLVSSLFAMNDDLPMEDYAAYKADIAAFTAFYESLGHAGMQFNTRINNLGVRIQVLQNLLRNYAFERASTLYATDDLTIDQALELNELLRRYYDRDGVAKLLQHFEATTAAPENKEPKYDVLLRDPRLAFPDYAVNQARYITDELLAISNDYVLALNDYQKTIETVLTSAPNIVANDKAEKKIGNLRTKLVNLEKAFRSAVNVEDVQLRFQKLSGAAGA